MFAYLYVCSIKVVTMSLQLMILLLASRLSLNAGLNDLEKQVAVLKIGLDKQVAELKQLKSITEIQNEKISLLNQANEDRSSAATSKSKLYDRCSSKSARTTVTAKLYLSKSTTR